MINNNTKQHKDDDAVASDPYDVYGDAVVSDPYDVYENGDAVMSDPYDVAEVAEPPTKQIGRASCRERV